MYWRYIGDVLEMYWRYDVLSHSGKSRRDVVIYEGDIFRIVAGNERNEVISQVINTI